MTPTNKHLGRAPIWWGKPEKWAAVVHRAKLVPFLGGDPTAPLTPEQEDRAADAAIRFLGWPEWIADATTTLWVADPWLAWVPAESAQCPQLPLWVPARSPRGLALTRAQLSVLGLVERYRSPSLHALPEALVDLLAAWGQGVSDPDDVTVVMAADEVSRAFVRAA